MAAHCMQIYARLNRSSFSGRAVVGLFRSNYAGDKSNTRDSFQLIMLRQSGLLSKIRGFRVRFSERLRSLLCGAEMLLTI